MMAAVLERIQNYAQWADSVADERTKNWPLISTPTITYSLVALYLLVVTYGPRFMATRSPFELKYPMLIYNLGLVILSGFMFKEFFVSSILNPNFNKVCSPVDYSDDVWSVRLAGACWWFFISKIIELLDTLIFILRKKDSQVTFLHVYHHATMPLLWWVGVRWIPGGSAYFSGMANCFVHVLMYSYYFLSALGPRIQPYLWWKKYLTSLQLIQFVTVLVQALVVLYHSCGFPELYVYALVAYLISHIILFSDFYNKAYLIGGKKRKAKKASAKEENDVGTPRKNGRYNLRERPPKTPKFEQ